MAKEAIFTVLSRKFWVRKTEENFNNEFGVSETVIGINPRLSTANLRFKNWLRLLKFWNQIVPAFWLAFGLPKKKYPKALVLELAAAKPGDIDYLADIVRPEIGVITAVGEVPVHVGFYASPEEVAKEKSKLITRLPAHNGLAVLNYDDQTVLDMKETFGAKVVTFGFSNLADVWASDVSYFAVDDNQNIGGLSFKINSKNTFIPIRINKFAGQHQIYGILAATAVGLHFGMNLVDIAGALENIDLQHGRMNLLSGIKNSVVIDDTYNASPLSMHGALDALKNFTKAKEELGRKGRRIAVLGDMRELGKYEIEAHRAIGNLAAECCDLLVTVGNAAKLIADSAANQMSKENIMSFNTSEEAKLKVQEMIKENDVVLVKGSRAMKMEKIVEEIALDSQKSL
ncbi:MAG: hypothetical protein HYT61_01920 [Candidatus Yanofskybacteria bacterium]|nr:hypothetical protein [Candidatus Yanofskybacteria bacterium]